MRKLISLISRAFKRQTVTHIFNIFFSIHLSIYLNYQQACECLMKKTMQAADGWQH